MATPAIVRRARVLSRIARTAARHARDERARARTGAVAGPECVLLVLGCQRSGTTLVTRVFARDRAAKVYPEQSSLTLGDFAEHLRLPEVGVLAERLARSHFPLVVLKPLVESQNARGLLAGLPHARALWMFRHWADVARSNLERFGEQNGLRNLRRVLERRARDWRAESVPAEIHDAVARSYSDAMNPFDAAALFWWVRNAQFFEQGLDGRADVRLCRYEHLVADPETVMRDVYAFVGRPFPGREMLAGVRATSVGLGAGVEFSAEIAERCDAMLERLLAVDAARAEAARCA